MSPRLTALALATGLTVLGAAGAHGQGGLELLPDLAPAAPERALAVAATDGSGRVYLTFTALVQNLGAGPFLISGHRASALEPELVADQVVPLPDRTTRTVPGVGRLRYDPELRRWGLTPYLSYELRRTSDGALVATGPEVGFCVADSLDADPATTLPGETPAPRFLGCGRRGARLLEVEEGISVGWASRHLARQVGQLVDITTLPAGSYFLVHRIPRSFAEQSVENNASSSLLSIERPRGATLPIVRTIKTCPGRDVCKPDRRVQARLVRVRLARDGRQRTVAIRLLLSENVRVSLSLTRGRRVLAQGRARLEAGPRRIRLELAARVAAGRATLTATFEDAFRNTLTSRRRVSVPPLR